MKKGIEQHNNDKPPSPRRAPGKPGDKPHWASGAKTIVGTSATPQSRIWYTVGNGVLNEIYFPDVDQANTRSIRFLVSDGAKFFSDEEWDANHKVTWLQPGVPGCRIESECKRGMYRIEKEIISDPIRDILLMRVRFEPRQVSGKRKLRLFLHFEPHVGDKGADNNAWIGNYKGKDLLVAQRAEQCMAVALEPPMARGCVGYSGTSDGLYALSRHEPLPRTDMAMQGNIGMTAEVDLEAAQHGSFTVSIACGNGSAEAGQQARAGVLQEYVKTRDLFLREWKEKQETYESVEDLSGRPLDMYRVSTAVLETHQSKRFPGGFVASLSLPWGWARSDNDVGGYHVLWPRDMVETAMGKLASGDARSARSCLFYLSCTQNPDGGWSQNMWLDGTEHWGAIQMDSIALPILLADALRRRGALDGYGPTPMVREAVRFLLSHGPVTQQDRWEAIPGYSPYTIATEVAALLAAADMLEAHDGECGGTLLRETADAWNDCIDEFTYVENTPLAKRHGVGGYYIRMAPPSRIQESKTPGLNLVLPNLPDGSKRHDAATVLSPDAIELVRFGLRAADDKRMLNTVKVLDANLKRKTTTGVGWVRSSFDGYGERANGAPFVKHGIGRVWPLLAGERGHYEIARGNRKSALALLKTIARQTSACGMIPEQIWDGRDIPSRFLYNGKPAGSGMPLVWAHAEYIKLLRSLHSGEVWDMPPQTVQRYQREHMVADFQIWTPSQPRRFLRRGKDLRVDLQIAAHVHWAANGDGATLKTEDVGFGLFIARIPTAAMAAGTVIRLRIVPMEPSADPPKPSTAKIQIYE